MTRFVSVIIKKNMYAYAMNADCRSTSFSEHVQRAFLKSFCKLINGNLRGLISYFILDISQIKAHFTFAM